MTMPTIADKQKAALEEIARAMNLILNEVAGTIEGGVKPETFDRARRAYDKATSALRDEMREFREAAQKRQSLLVRRNDG